MDQETRDRIRHLYFVERVPLHAIAETLTLSPREVRGALVLPGGQADWHDPAPMQSAIALAARSHRRAHGRHR
jgi:hypothetical protein